MANNGIKVTVVPGQLSVNECSFVAPAMFSHVTFGLTVAFLPIIAAIALEHPLKVNKSASALIGAGLLWTVYAIMGGDHLLISDNDPGTGTPGLLYL